MANYNQSYPITKIHYIIKMITESDYYTMTVKYDNKILKIKIITKLTNAIFQLTPPIWDRDEEKEEEEKIEEL